MVRVEETRNFIRKLSGKHSIRRPRRRWKDNVKLDQGELGCEARNLVK